MRKILTDDVFNLFSGTFNHQNDLYRTLTKVLLLPEPKHGADSGHVLWLLVSES